jgi:cytochrome c peroxidase
MLNAGVMTMKVSSLLLMPLACGLLAVSVAAQPLAPVEQLGKELFFDNISSPSASMSCASCHAPKAGWVGGVGGFNLHGAVYPGAARQRFGNRKPPTSAYSTYAPNFGEADGEFIGGVFWDGRATGERLGNAAADQALGPFLNPVEQNMPSAQAVCDHVARSKYAKLFIAVWGPLDCGEGGYQVAFNRIGWSIAAYEGSAEVSPFSSKFDAYWRVCRAAGFSAEACGLAEGGKGDLDPQGILSEQEFDGLIEFGEYCSACHVSHVEGPGGRPPLFTDFRFANIGVPKNPANPFYRMDQVLLDDGLPINPEGALYIDRGLGDFLRTFMHTKPEWAAKAYENDGKFRTPTVRNVDARPGQGFPKAYMHNGVFKSLEQVVHFYNTRDVPAENWPPPEVPYNVNREIFEGVPLGNFMLSAEQEAATVAFLKTLTDGWEGKKLK